jgi:response regulator RpfG family c-di-GMP phosphodiesterase
MIENKVLFVDDEENILNSIKRGVLYEDYTVIFAESGEKALEIMKDNEISVIVSDMKMPNMNGLDLLKQVKEISPDTIRIVLSGYNDIAQVLATINNLGVFKYISKPWNDDADFLPAIREALVYYNLKAENTSLKKQLEEKNNKKDEE